MLILTMAYQDATLRRKIFRDKYNAIVFRMQRGNVYLVGGYIRDLLRGIDSLDRDYILQKDLHASVSDVQKRVGGKTIRFKKGNMIRVAVTKDSTLDFSEMHGNLYQDLSGRDFTVNALAWSPEQGIIDYFHGMKDLEKKIIRAIAQENILADPLRMLRAYRFAAELGGTIEANTRKIVKTFNHRIKDISPERITLEVFHLLNSEGAAKYLNMANEDGLLKHIFNLKYNELYANIKSIAIGKKDLLEVLPEKIKVRLKTLYSQNLTSGGMLWLEMLIKSRRSAAYANNLLQLSNKISGRIGLVHAAVDHLSGKKPDVFGIFMRARDASTDALIISRRADLLREYERFRKIWKRGFLTSGEIREISGIGEGAKLGSLIVHVKREQFERKIRTRAQAIHYVKSAGAGKD